MVEELVHPVLVLVIGFAVRFAAKFLKIDLDQKAFDTIIAALVAFVLANVFNQPIQGLLGG